MSEIKVNSIKGVGASSAAITVNNTDGTCTANITNNLSNRNLIINGAMQVAQRGTSSSSFDFATVDRFRFIRRATVDNLNITQSQSTDSPDEFAASYMVDVTTAESDLAADEYFYMSYKTEAQDLQHIKGKQLTLSFHVKAYQTGTYSVSIYQQDGNLLVSGTYTINSSATWEKKTITFPANSGTQPDNNNAQGFEISWILAAGSNFTSSNSTSWTSYSDGGYAYGQGVNVMSSTDNYWKITGVQLEVGSVATDFEHRSIGQELALCQRYCFVWKSNQSYSVWGTGYMTHSTGVDFSFTLPQTMRASPSFSSSGSFRLVGYENDTQYAQALSSFSMTRSHTLTPYLRGVISGGVGGAVGELSDNGSNNATAIFSAEL